MIAFLDTEFTDLVVWPRLLSVGLVTARGREFYAEVTDRGRLHDASRFGIGSVLPQFGNVAHAACTYAELGGRIAEFLGGLTSGLEVGEFVEVAHGYPLDWELVDLAIRDADCTSWAAIRRRIRPVNVWQLTGSGPGKLAGEAYLDAQSCSSISRHHALCDARALRLSYEAATVMPVPSSEARPPPTQHRSPVYA